MTTTMQPPLPSDVRRAVSGLDGTDDVLTTEETFARFHLPDAELSPLEVQERILAETDAEVDLLTVCEAWQAIREHELFRERGYPSFKAYTESFHGIKRAVAGRYADAAAVNRILVGAGVPGVTSMNQGRALAPFMHNPTLLISIWNEARERSANGRHTAPSHMHGYKLLCEVVRDRRESGALGPNRSKSASLAQRQRLIDMAAQGYSSEQIAQELGVSIFRVRQVKADLGVVNRADARTSRPRVDGNRIVRESISTLEGLMMGLDLVDYSALDPAQVEDWLEALRQPLNALHNMRTRLKELANGASGN